MVDVAPADHGFALFGPDFGVPTGGFCASVFASVRRDGDLLVGRMSDDPVWAREWQPNIPYYEGDRRDALFEGWRLPATYLREGEHPEEAAKRVWSDQLGFDGTPELPHPTILSVAAPSRRRPGSNHWDLIFLYEVRGPVASDPARDHWDRITYRSLADLEPDAFVMGHGDLLEELP